MSVVLRVDSWAFVWAVLLVAVRADERDGLMVDGLVVMLDVLLVVSWAVWSAASWVGQWEYWVVLWAAQLELWELQSASKMVQRVEKLVLIGAAR